jgi:hypothetical protein
MVGHRCNVSNQEPKDRGGLTWSITQRKKHLRVDKSMGRQGEQIAKLLH